MTGQYFGQEVEIAEIAVPRSEPQPSVVAPAQHARLDALEARMLEIGTPVELPVAHSFTPGLYRRTIVMPAGTLLTSRIHNTEHPFVVVAGSASVYIPGVGVEHIQAPYFGVTKPGTRRVLYIHETCVWATYHPITPEEEAVEGGDEARVAAIEGRIIERRELLPGKSTFELYSALLEEAKQAGLLASSSEGAGNG